MISTSISRCLNCSLKENGAVLFACGGGRSNIYSEGRRGATLVQKRTAAGSEQLQSGCGSSHTVQESQAGDWMPSPCCVLA